MKKVLFSFVATAAVLSANISQADSSEVAALRQQINELNARLNALESKSGSMGSDRMHKQSDPNNIIHSRNDKVKLTVGGHVSVAAAYADDGAKTGTYYVTNNNSTTRGHFIAEAPITDDLSAQSIFEFGYRPNNSSNQSIRTNDTSTDFDPRRAEFLLNHKTFGTIYLGKGPTATDDSSEQDLSGTYIATAMDLTNSFYFVNKGETTIDTSTSPRMADLYNHFDGDSRQTRFRYDTPKFYGLQLRVGHSSSGSAAANQNTHDAGLFYGAGIKGYTIRAAIAAVRKNRNADRINDNYSQYNGSASVLAPFGTNISFSAGKRDYKNRPGGKNAETYFVKLGQQVGMLDYGKTMFSVDYGQTRNLRTETDKKGTAKLFGATVLQKFDRAATEIYLTWRGHQFNVQKASTKDYKDIHVVLLGARLKF
jgi:hypothetical protein